MAEIWVYGTFSKSRSILIVKPYSSNGAFYYYISQNGQEVAVMLKLLLYSFIEFLFDQVSIEHTS